MTEEGRHITNIDRADISGAWDSFEDVSDEFVGIERRKDRQLNLRVDADFLDGLRRLAAQRGLAYHSMARTYIEEGVARDLARLPVEDTDRDRRFSMKEAILVFLAAKGTQAEHEEILGRTRLQKLLFLMTQHLKPDVAARFEAHNYGPFDEFVDQDIEFLKEEGFLDHPGGKGEVVGNEERGVRLLTWIQARTADPDSAVESYRLTAQGLDWVRRFLSSEQFGEAEAKQRLIKESENLKTRFGRVPLEELVDYVYAEFPEFTQKSRIRDKVAARRTRKSDERR